MKPMRAQDAHVYVSENDADQEQNISLAPARQAYLVCIEGELDVNGVPLTKRDALEAVNTSDSEQLAVSLKSGAAGSHYLLIEMARA